MRRIKKNHSREHPRNLVFVDTECYKYCDQGTETDQALLFRLVCWQGVKHYGTHWVEDETFSSDKASDFWDWVLSKCKPKSVLWIVAHNLWFDLTMLRFKELMNSGRITLASPHRCCKASVEGSCKNCRCWKGSISLDTGASFATVRLDGSRVNCIDSFNYYRCSLERIGESHGLEKFTMPEELDNEETWQRYCKRDVHIVKTAMCELIKGWYIHDLGNFQFTAPGLAFSCYRHRFMHQSIVVHDNKHVQEDEQAAYYGGEVAVFFKGTITQSKKDLYADDGLEVRKYEPTWVGPVWHIDCNSLYPSVMRDMRYPAMYLGTTDHPSIKRATDDADEFEAVASVLVDTKDASFPFRCGDRIWFPTGRFPTTLCGSELRYGLATGAVKQVFYMHLYEEKQLFKEWVDYWITSREQAEISGRKAYAEFCKLMANSLAGKFAQRYRKWRVDSRSNRMTEWGKWPRYLGSKKQWQICRALGRLIQVQDNLQYADHALVAISACITAAGRTYMRVVRGTAGERNVLYQDTDSLFVTETGFKALVDADYIHPTQLGKFKVKEVILEGGIYGRQDYEADGRIVKAGLPKNCERIGHRRWRFCDIESPESMLSRLPDGTIRVKQRVLSGSELCSGRSYKPDGWSVPREAQSVMRECGIYQGE